MWWRGPPVEEAARLAIWEARPGMPSTILGLHPKVLCTSLADVLVVVGCAGAGLGAVVLVVDCTGAGAATTGGGTVVFGLMLAASGTFLSTAMGTNFSPWENGFAVGGPCGIGCGCNWVSSRLILVAAWNCISSSCSSAIASQGAELMRIGRGGCCAGGWLTLVGPPGWGPPWWFFGCMVVVGLVVVAGWHGGGGG